VTFNPGCKPMSLLPGADPALRGLRLPACWAHVRAEEATIAQADATFATIQSRAGPQTVELGPDGTTTTVNSIPTVCLQGVLLTEGKWYYEVELIEEGMVHRTKLGWADTMFTSHANQNLGVGDDKHSWSFCPSNDDGDRGVIGDRALKCFNGGREVWGDRWRPRDVIGVAVRLLATY